MKCKDAHTRKVQWPPCGHPEAASGRTFTSGLSESGRAFHLPTGQT